MEKYVILGILVEHFSNDAVLVQQILSEYGCSIRTRLGLHNAREGVCSPGGLILVDFVGGEEKADEMASRLGAVHGVSVKKMVL